MKGLMVKDMLYIRQNLRVFSFAVFMAVMCAVITASKGKVPEGLGVAAALFLNSLPMLFIADDQRTGYEKTLAYSPISKDDMVKARYLMILAVGLASSLIVLLIIGIGAYIGSAPVGEVLAETMMFMVTMLVFLSLCLPLVYYFRKSNAVMVISFVVSVGLSVVSSILFKDGMEENMDISLGTAAVMLIAALVITAVSYMISVRIFRKTDIC
ncbi:MAG: ABC-2 transporter permease [Ruminococcus sp.]|uniref:ABC-2 transporter permease n=1 Tax=Ruminococcus sp. TaxID=41978 RepID=UPI0025FF2C8E|nr:ABC-2 transporter permease [Ruminococcus sp.]MCR5539927.1 ABC-2 transporter permease [Ruminococcus sp.]